MPVYTTELGREKHIHSKCGSGILSQRLSGTHNPVCARTRKRGSSQPFLPIALSKGLAGQRVPSGCSTFGLWLPREDGRCHLAFRCQRRKLASINMEQHRSTHSKRSPVPQPF